MRAVGNLLFLWIIGCWRWRRGWSWGRWRRGGRGLKVISCHCHSNMSAHVSPYHFVKSSCNLMILCIHGVREVWACTDTNKRKSLFKEILVLIFWTLFASDCHHIPISLSIGKVGRDQSQAADADSCIIWSDVWMPQFVERFHQVTMSWSGDRFECLSFMLLYRLVEFLSARPRQIHRFSWQMSSERVQLYCCNWWQVFYEWIYFSIEQYICWSIFSRIVINTSIKACY